VRTWKPSHVYARCMFDQEKTPAAPPDELRRRHQDILEKERAGYRLNQCNVATDCAPPTRAIGDTEILAELFSYHPLTTETLPKFIAINQAAKNFAEVVLQNCPRSADRSAAIRLIRDARMTANAAVALNGLSL
jgi:hypothetical protein